MARGEAPRRAHHCHDEGKRRARPPREMAGVLAAAFVLGTAFVIVGVGAAIITVGLMLLTRAGLD